LSCGLCLRGANEVNSIAGIATEDKGLDQFPEGVIADLLSQAGDVHCGFDAAHCRVREGACRVELVRRGGERRAGTRAENGGEKHEIICKHMHCGR
jgi:hypothetical protein